MACGPFLCTFRSQSVYNRTLGFVSCFIDSIGLGRYIHIPGVGNLDGRGAKRYIRK